MKHIKKYKVFEKVDIDDMKKSCEEILFDMEDCKYTVNVKNYLDKDINRFLGYTSINDRINIIIKLPEFDNLEQLYNFYIDTKEVRDETILRLLDYMKQKNGDVYLILMILMMVLLKMLTLINTMMICYLMYIILI